MAASEPTRMLDQIEYISVFCSHGCYGFRFYPRYGWALRCCLYE